MRLAGDAQLPPDTPGSIAGSVGDYAPLTIGRADAGHTNWASGFVNMAYFIWHLHGDTAVITRNMPKLERYVEFNERVYNSSGGLRKFKGGCINGWITIGSKPSCAVMTGFGYVNDYRVMAEMAAAVGAPSAARYATLFKARLAEFHASFYDARNGTVRATAVPACARTLAANLGSVAGLSMGTARSPSWPWRCGSARRPRQRSARRSLPTSRRTLKRSSTRRRA